MVAYLEYLDRLELTVFHSLAVYIKRDMGGGFFLQNQGRLNFVQEFCLDWINNGSPGGSSSGDVD